MADSAEWQCRNCGEHPSSFVGDKPSTRGRCSVSGNHVWMRVPEGTTNTRDWQCMHCGEHPSSFVGHRPASRGRCSGTGNKHVWIQL